MRAQWKNETNLLIEAVNAETKAETMKITRQFLEQRDQRHLELGLDPTLLNYERRFEWLEGLAKYVELAIWEQASQSSGYLPISDMVNDPDFKGYETFKSHWNREIQQAKSQSQKEGDVRFYYTGMAQAFLLDRLMPDWKSKIMSDGVWLEDLLRQSVDEK